MPSIKLINIPSELGAGTRGSSLGFKALEVAGWNKGSNLLARFERFDIEVENGELYKEDPNPHAHRVAALKKVFENTADALEQILAKGDFPLSIGADHSVAAGTISGLKKFFPEKRIGVIWIDAHGDLHTPYTSPSGNIHGMPLSIVLGEDNLEERKNDPKQVTIEEWQSLKGLHGIQPKVLHDDIVFFGVRDTESEEDALIARHSIRNYTVDEIRSHSISDAIKGTVDRLKNCDLVYISFDVDSMDPRVTSHGTGTPVENGFTPQEALTIIKLLFEKLPVCCFEMVEINPTLDEKCNKMAEISFDILEQVVHFIEEKIKS